MWHYGLCWNRPVRQKIMFSLWDGNCSLPWLYKDWRLLSYSIFLVRQHIKVPAKKRILQYITGRRPWFLMMWLYALQYRFGVFSEKLSDNLKRQTVSTKNSTLDYWSQPFLLFRSTTILFSFSYFFFPVPQEVGERMRRENQNRLVLR